MLSVPLARRFNTWRHVLAHLCLSRRAASRNVLFRVVCCLEIVRMPLKGHYASTEVRNKVDREGKESQRGGREDEGKESERMGGKEGEGGAMEVEERQERRRACLDCKRPAADNNTGEKRAGVRGGNKGQISRAPPQGRRREDRAGQTRSPQEIEGGSGRRRDGALPPRFPGSLGRLVRGQCQ